VDGHFAAAGVPPSRVYAIHGELATWQCAAPCTRRTFRLPAARRFIVDPETMRAPRAAPLQAPAPPVEHAAGGEGGRRAGGAARVRDAGVSEVPPPPSPLVLGGHAASLTPY
jgi:hypothetical protein